MSNQTSAVYIALIGLGYLSIIVAVLVAWCCFHSRKIYLQEKTVNRLALAVVAVEALVDGLRGEISTLRDKDTGDLDQAGQDALAERLEALVGQATPVIDDPEDETADEGETPVGTLPGEVVAEPVTGSSGEVSGGVLPDEVRPTEDEIDSGPVGEAKPEGNA